MIATDRRLSRVLHAASSNILRTLYGAGSSFLSSNARDFKDCVKKDQVFRLPDVSPHDSKRLRYTLTATDIGGHSSSVAVLVVPVDQSQCLHPLPLQVSLSLSAAGGARWTGSISQSDLGRYCGGALIDKISLPARLNCGGGQTCASDWNVTVGGQLYQGFTYDSGINSCDKTLVAPIPLNKPYSIDAACPNNLPCSSDQHCSGPWQNVVWVTLGIR